MLGETAVGGNIEAPRDGGRSAAALEPQEIRELKRIVTTEFIDRHRRATRAEK